VCRERTTQPQLQINLFKLQYLPNLHKFFTLRLVLRTLRLLDLGRMGDQRLPLG